MKTMSKKLASIVLALCLCFSLVGTALAASSPETTGSITVKGTAGEQYTIYQIFDLTYADDGSSYSYKAVDDWVEFLTSYTTVDGVNLFELDSNNYLKASSAVFDEDNDSDVMVAFAKAALDYATTAGIESSGTKVADESGDAVFENLSLGWYLVDSTQGALCILDSTAPSATVNEKNPVPSISKFVRDEDYNENFDSDGDGEDDETKDEADNSDTIEYELVINNVHDIASLIIHDYMDTSQLDLETLELESVTLYANDESGAINGTTLTLNTDYTFTVGTCSKEDCGLEGCTFEIAIINNSILEGLGSEAYIVVLYTINLNEQADSFVDDVDEIDNFANVTFGISGVGTPVEVETYSYGFKIYKYTDGEENEEGETEQIALADAEFVISKTSGESTVYAKFTQDVESGIYLFDSWVDSQVNATTLVSDSDGIIHVDGLHDGTFTVTETKAPDGYNMLADSIIVTITATSDDLGTFTLTQDGDEVEQIEVLNQSGAVLPGTGGMGTTIFYIIGGVLVAGAVVVLITRRRMSSNEG